MEKNNQVANSHDRELIRCIKEEDGKTIVKYLSPFVVKSEYLFERTGFKPADPNLDEKLAVKEEVSDTTHTEANVTTDIQQFAQTSTASDLIERFEDDGKPRKKRKRIQNIKTHAD